MKKSTETFLARRQEAASKACALIMQIDAAKQALAALEDELESLRRANGAGASRGSFDRHVAQILNAAEAR